MAAGSAGSDAELRALEARCRDLASSFKYVECVTEGKKFLAVAQRGGADVAAWTGVAWLWIGRGLGGQKKKKEGRAAFKKGIVAMSAILAQASIDEEMSKLARSTRSRLAAALKRSQSRSRSPRRPRDGGKDSGDGKYSSESRTASALVGSDKFPSIPHVPFSPQVHSDDTKLGRDALSCFTGVPVVVTEKLDGGNCCLYGGDVYARTHKHPATHASFGPIKALYAGMDSAHMDRTSAYFGEAMVAQHSIAYRRLRSYFYLFAVKNANGWVAWDDVIKSAASMGVPHASVVFKGVFGSAAEIKSLMDRKAQELSAVCDQCNPEGFVIRVARSFSDAEFKAGRAVAKYVRKGHCQTSKDWGRTWVKAKLWSGDDKSSDAKKL